MEKVQTAASQMCGQHVPGLMPQLQAKGVVQAVKAICALMGNVETQDITESVESFESVCLQFIPAPTVINPFLSYIFNLLSMVEMSLKILQPDKTFGNQTEEDWYVPALFSYFHLTHP